MNRRHLSLRAALAALTLLGASHATTANATTSDCRAPLELWTEIGLYFGRDIAGTGEVSEAQFRQFLAQVVTPRFPDGLTVVDATGQFRAGRKIVREKTKLVVILVPGAVSPAAKIAGIVGSYKDRFRQQSVLRTETSVCLSFD